jgi:hypothetical protein
MEPIIPLRLPSTSDCLGSTAAVWGGPGERRLLACAVKRRLELLKRLDRIFTDHPVYGLTREQLTRLGLDPT